ncbi:MAG: hypothetical protein RJB38_781 [Pseudomonadota bacterium]|jgi:hypothetical protein
MKLTLNRQGVVEILTTSGEIAARDISILKAGIGKLIRDGKNQILLEHSEDSMPDELIRELMALDLLSRELAGRMVIVATQSALRTKLQTFARPMTLESFSDRAAAFQFFEKLNSAPLGPIEGEKKAATTKPDDKPSAAAAVTQPPAPSAPPAATGAAVASASGSGSAAPAEPGKVLKEDIRQRELNELGALRETISRLENENKALLAQFQSLFLERKLPPDERAYQMRIAELEAKLEKHMADSASEKVK